MKYILNEMPPETKPREKLVKNGAESLMDYELLAIILRTGTRDLSVLDLSINLLEEILNLNNIENITLAELTSIRGIGRVKAIEILAVLEFCKRINKRKEQVDIIKSSRDSYFFLKQSMQNLDQEYFCCLYLTNNNEVICKKVISIGTLNQTIASPRDVMKWGLKYSAYAFIIAHNHPSGAVFPSDNDILLTNAIIEAAKTVGLIYVDHIIIGKNKYYSFHEKKVINI